MEDEIENPFLNVWDLLHSLFCLISMSRCSFLSQHGTHNYYLKDPSTNHHQIIRLIANTEENKKGHGPDDIKDHT